MSKQLPARPNLDHLRAQAKELLSSFRLGEPEAVSRIANTLPALSGMELEAVAKRHVALHDAQSTVARELGFKSWPELVQEVERVRATEGITSEVADSFVSLAVSGGYKRCLRFLELYPGLAHFNPVTAMVCGERAQVKSWLESSGDELVASKLGPKDWLPIEYVCHSMLNLLGESRSEGLLETARLLLDHGADPNSSHLWGSEAKSPLSILFGAAGETGHIEIVRLLLERGANPNDGESIYHAAQHDRGDILELLVAHGGDISSRSEHWKNTPMFFLAGHRPSDPGWAPAMRGIEWLLEHGADPNVPCYENQATVLHCACRTGNSELARVLLRYGADPLAKQTDGFTPFDLAAVTGNSAAMEALREAGGSHQLRAGEAVVAACAADDLATAQDLIMSHPELAPRMEKEGGRALVKLAELGVIAGVRNLLTIGCDVATTGEDGATALHFACFCGWAECVDLLLDRGAPLNARDTSYDATPLQWAIQGLGWNRNPRGDYVGIVRSLLAAGADGSQIREAMDRGEEEAAALFELRPLLE